MVEGNSVEANSDFSKLDLADVDQTELLEIYKEVEVVPAGMDNQIGYIIQLVLYSPPSLKEANSVPSLVNNTNTKENNT